MQYDLVIIGATAAALGLARSVKDKRKTLIVNPTEMVAYEFVYAYKTPVLYTQGAHFCKEFKDTGVDILLGAELAGVTRLSQGFALELLTSAGFLQIRSSMVVDTTTDAEPADSLSKSLNALIIQQEGKPIPALDWEGIKLVPDAEEEAYRTALLKLTCPPELRIAEARHDLVDRWLQRPDALKEWRIAAIAFTFECVPSQGLRAPEPGWTVLPSAYYSTPEESMAAGADWGRRMLEC